MKNLPVILAAVAWGLVVFLGGLHLGFPSGAAKQRLQLAVQQGSDGEWAIDATEVSPWRLSGLSAEDVVLYRVNKRPRPDEPAAVPMVRMASLAVRAQVLPLVASFLPGTNGGRMASFQAELYGGEVDGAAGSSGTRRQIMTLADGVDLSKVPIEGEAWSIDLQGMLDLDLDLVTDVEDIERSHGYLKLDIEDLVLVGGQAMGEDVSNFAEGLLPATFTEAVLEIEVDDGVAEVKKGSFVSDAVEAEISGDITLRKNLGRSRANLQVKLKINESLQAMVNMVPMMGRAKDDEGVYHLVWSGMLSRPSFREDRAAIRGSATTPRRNTTRPTRNIRSAGSDNDEEAEARRKAREERLEAIRARRAEREQEREQQPDEEDLGPEDEFEDEYDDELDGPMDDELGPEDEFLDEEPIDDLGYIEE